MDIPSLSEIAKRKGINLLGTGDALHPEWMQRLESYLEEKTDGIFVYPSVPEVHYILSTEISLVFNRGFDTKKIHIVLLFPNFKVLKEVSKLLSKYGNLSADGRPTLTIDTLDFSAIITKNFPDVQLIPAHVWTPWFSLFGSRSGFNSVEEAFGEYTDKILALETGLSSDPPMNWRLSSLDRFPLVSNSDAHSPFRIGREANIFNVKNLTYDSLIRAIKSNSPPQFEATIEYYPQEGKYHYDGHRNCGVRFHPKETIQQRGICPVCQRPLTVGVLHRIERLADRPEGFKPNGVPNVYHLVPLMELIQKSMKTSERKAEEMFMKITEAATEFEILLKLEKSELMKFMPAELAGYVINARKGKVKIEPGFDGVYGKVEVIKDGGGTLFDL